MSKTCIYSMIILLGFVLSSCTLKQPQEPVSQSQAERSPLIAFQLQYDEETTTYALHWPGQMVTGLAKSAGTNELLLADYQNVHTTVTVDTAGYVSLTNENIEGNESVRMPQEVYNAVKDELPAQADDFDPVVRWELVAGQLTSFTQSGAIQSSVSMDPEQYRLDPALLNSLNGNLIGDTLNTQTRKERLVARLSQQGISYNMIGDNRLAINNAIERDGQTYSTTIVLDLSTGLVIRSALFNDEEQPLMISIHWYQKVEGIPVIKFERTYIYGDLDGSWNALYMSDSFRNNIKVYRKNS